MPTPELQEFLVLIRSGQMQRANGDTHLLRVVSLAVFRLKLLAQALQLPQSKPTQWVAGIVRKPTRWVSVIPASRLGGCLRSRRLTQNVSS